MAEEINNETENPPENTSMSQEDFDGGLIITTKYAVDRILKTEKPLGALGLYFFYLYTAKWQNTWTLKATTNYAQKGLGMSKAKVIEAKKILTELGLIKDFQRINKQGQVSGHYIKLLTPANQRARGGESQRVDNQDTNAYNTNTINAYNNIINASDGTSPSVKELFSGKLKPPQLPVTASGQTEAARLYKLYGAMWKKKYSFAPSFNFARDLKILKDMSKKLGEYRTAMTIIVFMGWKGTSGNDGFITRMLENSCHSLTQLSNQVVPIHAYVKNVLGLNIENEKDIISAVDDKLKQLNIYDKDSASALQNGQSRG